MQRALAQENAGNTSENSRNKIRKIIYYLYREKEITKKVYDNIMNSKQISYKMDTIFINLNSKTFDPDRLLLNFSHKINLKRSVKVVALLNLSIYYTWKDTKNSFKNNKLTTSAQT